jgi:hypothetical protein
MRIARIAVGPKRQAAAATRRIAQLRFDRVVKTA